MGFNEASQLLTPVALHCPQLPTQSLDSSAPQLFSELVGPSVAAVQYDNVSHAEHVATMAVSNKAAIIFTLFFIFCFLFFGLYRRDK